MVVYQEIVEQISYIARQAGWEIMRIYTGDYRSKLNVNKKFDQSPITNADCIANEMIVCALKKITPNIPVISEEYFLDWNKCREWSCFWLVDPLDGTKEFLSRNGEFTVNIALIEYGEPVMGVIFIPSYNILYAADNGRAWKINDKGNRINITVRASESPVILISRTHDQDNKQRLFSYLQRFKNYKIIKIGSSFKFCLIADGSAQFYPRFSCTKIWDIAAGHAIAKAAGAVIDDWNGHSLNYTYIDQLFLNPGFQVQVLSN